MNITSKAVERLQLEPGKTDTIHFDDSLHGFGYRLRLTTSGRISRTWICQYRFAGQSRRMRLGAAEVLGHEQARAKAKEILSKVSLGTDPQAQKIDRRTKDQRTLRSLSDRYFTPEVNPAGAQPRRGQAIFDWRIFPVVAQQAD